MPPVTTHGETHALLVMVAGQEALATYGSGFATPCGTDVTYISWSMAKSMTQALVGFMVKDGLVDIDEPAAVPEWEGDPRSKITLRHLLEMRSGLAWSEDYVDGSTSNVIDMLFGVGKSDHAAYAASQPLEHAPGTQWLYSSGTTNIICRILGDVLGGVDAIDRRCRMEEFIRRRLFDPLGMTSATAKFDAAGNFVGSSYVYATAADFARFGRMYVNRLDLLPAGWLDLAGTPVAFDPETGNGYGHHWWTWPRLPRAIVATGYEGQYTIVLPDEDVVVVRLGKTAAELRSRVVDDLVELIAGLH